MLLEAPDPARLEDTLASGARLRLQARASVLSGDDPRNAPLHLEQTGEDGRGRYAEEALTPRRCTWTSKTPTSRPPDRALPGGGDCHGGGRGRYAPLRDRVPEVDTVRQ